MWTLGDSRTIITDMTTSNKQIIARLNVLGGGTVHHVFGYDNKIIKVKGYIVHDLNRTILEGYTTDGTAHSLKWQGVEQYSVLVASVAFQRVNCVSQTIDPTKACTDPVYEFDMELYI